MSNGDLRMAGLIDRGRQVRIVVDDRSVLACEGESVAAALFAAGHRELRFTPRENGPRGYFCGMGLCYDCIMTIDGRPNIRACMTPVREGLRVESQQGLGKWDVLQ